ncbi:MAG TPA: vWA domain-containing protein [Gemmatimonadaceae bacterium]|nr:vWA domain-containing protein [Gemmatimonadaceae bacterium]
MAHWVESLFEFLFKYRPAEFAASRLAFGAPFSVIVLLLAAAVIGVPAVLSYASVRGRASRRDRWVLGAMRLSALLVLMACLFRPMLLLSAAVPQRNYVGVLIDDSRSMRIADQSGKPRSDWVERAFGGPDSALFKALRQKFIVRLFRFSSTTQRIDSAADLSFAAGETHVGAAVEAARQELEGVPLSGLVLLTDGADNSHAPISDELLSLRARSVPIFAVGLGADRFNRDIEIRRVEASHSVLKGGSLVADLLIRQRGFGGQRVPLVVEDAGRIVSRDSITLPPDGDAAPVRVTVAATEAGPRSFTFRIPVQPGEQVAENNVQQALVDVRNGREKILYLEGEPRYEMRFIRAAVEADSNLQLVVLQRTANDKFLRLNIDSASDLANGFPKTRAELYRYRAVIIGSVEASFFTHDQLAMLADFVNVRGGGLLLLGGRRSFGEGGYAGTPLADVMPVVISGNAVPDSMTFFADLKVALTPAGESHAVAQVAATPAASIARWKALPAVTTVNRIRDVKPGAVTLITGSTPPGGRAGEPGAPLRSYEQPVLVYQRYGRGLSIAFPVQDSWNWQMDPTSPPDDPTFTRFWRQLLRWEASDVPGRVVATLPTDQANPRSPIAIRASVADSIFVPRNDAKVVAHLSSDAGVSRDLPLDWAIDRDGEYRGTFTPDGPGIYTIRIDATLPSGATFGDTSYVRVADLNTEYFDAEMRAPLLERMAKETGGKFYTPATAGSLAADLALSKHGVTVVNQMDLWDMPIIFLLLVALVSAEWSYRKMRGLA